MSKIREGEVKLYRMPDYRQKIRINSKTATTIESKAKELVQEFYEKYKPTYRGFLLFRFGVIETVKVEGKCKECGKSLSSLPFWSH